VDTLYPFGLTLSYTVSATQAFPFKIRIPEWAKNAQSTIIVNRSKAVPVAPDASTSLQIINVSYLHINRPVEVISLESGLFRINNDRTLPSRTS
jgi:hypothetical protein